MNQSQRNQTLITADFLRYLPSRFYVLTNMFFIIPIFSKILTVKEMGTFQIAISILNLSCTIFFDWIAKSVLRFYEQYKQQDKIDQLISNVFIIYITNYIFLLTIYLLFKDKICQTLYIDTTTLLCVIILVFPCLMRQLLYQFLRLQNRPILYTLSIICYQIILVVTTVVCISNGINNVTSILISMAITIACLDFYIIKKLKISIISVSRVNTTIIKNCLKYGLPLVCTNFCIWGIYHYNKYYFQTIKDFNATGELALASYITTGILTAIFSTLLFATMPRIIKRYANGHSISQFITEVLKLYMAYFVPLTLIFWLFPQEITNIFTNNQYLHTEKLLPCFALCMFMHELGKIINVKYHLKNKTHIETIISFASLMLCVVLNQILIIKFGTTGAAIATMLGFIFWVTINASINFKDLKYIEYKSSFSTLAKCIAISILSYFLVKPINLFCQSNIVHITQIIAFITIYYVFVFRKKQFILK